MRRGGVISFVCYLIYMLCGLALAIASSIQGVDENLYLGISLGAVGLVSIVLHQLYMITGFRFFKSLCKLIHSLIAVIISFVLIEILFGGGSYEIYPVITAGSIFLLSFLSLISASKDDVGEISARRGGGASLGNYILLLIVGLIMAIQWFVGMLIGSGWNEEIGPYALLVISVSIAFIIIWKLYRRTGHVLLKVLCMLLDIAILSLVIAGALYVSEVEVYLFFFSPFLLFSFLSLMSYP